jgi:hypothetical protein
VGACDLHVSPFVLTRNLYAGVPGLQGNDNSDYVKQVKLIELLDDCHKQAVLISESCGDLNRCTPCWGKLNQHTTRIPHSVRIWPSTIRISCGPHIGTFRTIVNRFEQIHYP